VPKHPGRAECPILTSESAMETKIDINTVLEELGKALIKALTYRVYPEERITALISTIDLIATSPTHLLDCEIYFRTADSDNMLFYISNILYNLKTQSDLQMTPDELKWLGSVWKNFLSRNMTYQGIFKKVDEYKIKFKSYYQISGTIITQLDNVSMIREEFIENATPENPALMNLENHFHSLSEILSWMKPTYFFMLDYYYEAGKKALKQGAENKNTAKGLAAFGSFNYTYYELVIAACQCLGVLEAAYLIMKKKKTSKRIVTIDGKQKFLSTSEIYTIYLNKFGEMKKELSRLKQG
jgi:hypothetical protein